MQGGGIYQHSVVIHAQNFADPADEEIHAQNGESMWNRLKRKFKKMFGTLEDLYLSFTSLNF